MSDIVRRISDWSRNIPHNPWHGDDLLIEAAHEIEKLRGERDEAQMEYADLLRDRDAWKAIANAHEKGTRMTLDEFKERFLAATPQDPADDDQGGDQ